MGSREAVAMVKIDLITGFLGAGKTTFLKKYAEYLIAKGQNIGILENDFGAVNVDMMLLQDLMGDNCELEMVSGGLGGQAVQTFLLPLDFELGDGQVFFGAAALTALYIRVPGIAHIVEEIVLQDAVRLLQDWFAVLLQDGLSSIVQQGLGCPLLAPADLHDSLLDCADQCLVLAAFRPEDLLFHHRHIDHMKMVVVDLPA